jgi:HlyD family secretion protein
MPAGFFNNGARPVRCGPESARMNDKSELLGQLKIDRGAPSSGGGMRWPWIAGVVALLVVAAGGYALLRPDPAVAVSVATARAAGGGGAWGGSVLDATGYVVARRQATVSSKVTGKVTEVLIEEGQRVKENQVLARIDASNTRAQLALAQSQLDAARAQLAEVKVQLADAERTLARNRDLAEKKLISQQQLDSSQAQADALRARLESTESNVAVAQKNVEVQARFLDDTVVRAPFAGVITQKNAQPGEMISPLSAGGAGTRTGIGTLVDMDSLEIEVEVNENFINRVQAGQPAVARLNAYPDWDIPAAVEAVIPTADRSKATVKVRVKFQQLDPRILPDMGVRVAFMAEAQPATETAPAARGVLVPQAAVLQDGASARVFVVADGTARERRVTLGGPSGGEVAVLDGLSAGEQVAVSALDALRDGAAVRIGED